MAASWMAALLGWLLLIFNLNKTPFGETGCLSNFLGSLSMSPALHPGFSDLLRSPPALSSTPTTFGCLHFLMFRHPVFLFIPLSQHSQLSYLWLPVPHCAALV